MSYNYGPLVDDVLHGNVAAVRADVRKAMDNGNDLMEIVNEGLLKAMKIIGDRFDRNEIYVTELLVSARTVHVGLEEIKPHMVSEEQTLAGRIVIGSVAGDLHDLGKNLLILVLQSRGYEVIDLGVDVSASAFADAVNEYKPDVLCLSALLTTTVSEIETVNAALKDAHLRHRVDVVVGGAAVNQEKATQMGADGYGIDAIAGVRVIEELIERRRNVTNLDSVASILNDGEFLGMQSSFRKIAGVDMVFVDRMGRPLDDPGHFFDCSSRCGENSRYLKAMSYFNFNQHLSHDGDYPEAFAYRCRCGLMEISYPLIGEMGQIGSIICGHFLLEEDKGTPPPDIPVIPAEKCQALCDYITKFGRTLVQLVDSNFARRQLEGQQSSFVSFMKKQQQLEEALKEAELSALQYQVNPHFLFNSLNTIARVALLEGDKYTEKLVSALARLMRYSLYQVKTTVTLAEEVKTVQDYLMIQEARFQGRISRRVDVEPSILNSKMPCMILQPLVENACQHGLEPCRRGGIVSVQGWMENGQVFLEVSDNGIGMSEELQKNIFKLEIKSEKGGQVSGLGLNNVLKRLQAHFGSDCAWDIQSAINKGTTFQISFPYIT